jgi:glycine cleavage system regulatory protein
MRMVDATVYHWVCSRVAMMASNSAVCSVVSLEAQKADHLAARTAQLQVAVWDLHSAARRAGLREP